jgi:uncharacterized protein YecA (UPF0149 family)
MDYHGIEFIYSAALICRLLIYTLIIAWYDRIWVKYLTHNTKEYRQGLIKLYDNQQKGENKFMYAVLKKAKLELEAGKNPTNVEDWVVTMEKQFRTFLK